MAVTLIERFFETASMITLGFDSRGLALGMMITHGFGCPMVRGAHVLYMGVGGTYPNVDYTHAVGAISPTAPDPGTVKTFPGLTLPASSVLSFGVRAVSPGGVEERNTTQVQRVETDGDGIPLPLVPNPPTRLEVTAVAGGALVLSWRHSTVGEQTPPRTWRIYWDAGTGTIDYNTMLAEVVGIGYRTANLSDGQAYRFVVRAASKDGDEETNETEVAGTADASGPADIGAASVAAGFEE